MKDKAINIALNRLLRPLVKILMRYGISYGEFSELAKRAFVESAEADFQLPGRKQSTSRIAMLTGIQRKEVSRIRQLDSLDAGTLDAEYNRAVRVAGGWCRDIEFLDENKTPLALPFEGRISFASLVKRYSGDIPVRAVLDELIRVGTVEKDQQGLIKLVNLAGHVPRDQQEAQFNIMGNASRDFLETIAYNLEPATDNPHLQLTVAYNKLPLSAIEQFRNISHEKSLALLKQFDAWLSEHDLDSQSQNDLLQKSAILDVDRYRAGIGIYYFEEKFEETSDIPQEKS